MNMLRLGKAAYEHGYHGFCSKEKVMEWVGRMYECGQQQARISKLEEDGMVNTNSTDVIASGSYLDLWGKKEGYLSKIKNKIKK